MGQEALFEANDIDMRKLKSFAAMHGDQGDCIAFGFLLILAVIVERQFLEKILKRLRDMSG